MRGICGGKISMTMVPFKQYGKQYGDYIVCVDHINSISYDVLCDVALALKADMKRKVNIPKGTKIDTGFHQVWYREGEDARFIFFKEEIIESDVPMTLFWWKVRI